MRFVFWQNLASLHQLAFLRELSKTAEVRLYVDRLITPERASQGWPAPSAESFEIKVVSSDEVAALVAEAGPDALHLFAPRGCRTAPALLRLAKKQPLRHAFLAEMPEGRGFALLARAGLYRFLALTTRPEFLLAMGERAAAWYRRAGFRSVRPFGYSVDGRPAADTASSDRSVGFVFVGQFSSRKRPQDLVKALADLPPQGWRATFIGDGPLRARTMALAGEAGLADRIRWAARLPNDAARSEIAAHDVLVLCSEWEGWGAVINEAVAEGTRVVASDACGAACLLGLGDVGETYPARDVGALAAGLRRQLARGPVTPAERAQRRELSRQVAPAAFATYFRDILRGGSPDAPWKPVRP